MRMNSIKPWHGAVLTAGLAAGLLTTGCSANFGSVSAVAGPTSSASDGATLTGTIHGGQQPVSGATVQLWTVGQTGYGSTPTALGAAVTSNPAGGFTLGAYTCPSNSYTYITASGGNPQVNTSSTNNPAIALMAALGPCSGLSSIPFISMNEATTVAAVWALAPFMSVTQGTSLSSSTSSSTTTPSVSVGTSSGNLQGLANAMGVAQILASISTGVSPGTGLSANIENVEYWQVYTLADILAVCVNSNGTADATSNCPAVTTDTTPSAGTAPADTIQMALFLAQNPTAATGTGSTSLFAQIAGTGLPFQPTDATVNDWTIGYSVATGTSDTRWVEFDSYGNAWATSGASGGPIFEFSPTGATIATPTKYYVGGVVGGASSFGTPYELAIDTANNAWVTDETNHVLFEVTGSTSAGGANGGTTATSGTTTTYNPATSTAAATTTAENLEGIAIDGSNNIWASITSGTSVAGASVGLLSGSYNTLTVGGPATGSPFMIAVDMSNQTKFGNTTDSGGGSFLYGLNSGGCSGLITADAVASTGGSIFMDFTASTSITAGTTTTNYTPGQATPLNYFVDAACNNTTNIATSTTGNSGGTGTTTARNFMSTLYGIAFDKNNAMWVVNSNYTSTTDATSGHYSVSKMAPLSYGTTFTGAAVGPTITFNNYGGTSVGLNSPFYLAMDGASSAWVANSAGAGLSAFTNTGGAISPTSGFSGGTCTTSPCSTSARAYGGARGIAVDLSGNVWVANTSKTYLQVVVGVAQPVVVPLSLGVKNGTLGTLP
jgi:hypothetical protein